MKPILLSGHTRALTQVKYNRDGDLIFSVSKDQVICVWYSSNGERLGTYHGHVGAIWTVDVDPTTTLLASGSADNTIRLWEVRTGRLLKTWELPTAIKRVEFNENATKLLGVTEKRMGHLSNIVVYDINLDVDAEQPDEPSMRIVCDRSKATVAGWSSMSKYIIAGHEDGSISRYDGATGDLLQNVSIHDLNQPITDLQWDLKRLYFITACKDKTAKLVYYKDLRLLKTYVADTPLNSACITAVKDFVILGGGQAAMDVTTTGARQGKFEARIYHKIFEDEIGRIKGHFGPLNTVAADPTGKSYCSGGEDGYVRIHHFDPAYFEFYYEVERERMNEGKSSRLS